MSHDRTSRTGDFGEVDVLEGLRDVRELRVPPVRSVRRRAQAIRLARRRARLGLGVVLTAAVLGIGGVLVPQSSSPGTTPDSSAAAAFLGVIPARAANGSGADCSGAVNTRVERSQWGQPDVAPLVSLIPEAEVGAVRSASASRSELACPAVRPAAVLYATTPSVRGLTLWADVSDPYSGSEGLRDVTVRGAEGQVFTFGNGSMNLSWVAPDGTRWLAEASGLSESSVLQTLDAMRFEGHEVDDASIDPSWRRAPLLPGETGTTEFSWGVDYGSRAPQFSPEGDRLSLSVGMGTYPLAALAARGAEDTVFTSVRGRLAVYTTENGRCLRWQEAALVYSLCGNGGLDRLVHLAEQVQRVSPEDPRLRDAADPRDLPGEGW